MADGLIGSHRAQVYPGFGTRSRSGTPFGRVRLVNPSAPVYFPLQTIALEFLVTDRLDGITPSPPFLLPPDPLANLAPDNNAVRITVERLGLVDLTGGVPSGALADRLIRSLLIVGPNPVGVGVVATIGRAFDGIPDDNGNVQIPVGAIGIDSDNCLFVPQTAAVRLTGLVASPGNPILVRLLVWQPHTVEELAEMSQVCCCRANVFDEEGEPFFTQALYNLGTCARTVASVAPPTAPRGVGPQAITVTGTGFVDGDILVLISEDGTGTINVLSHAVTNATTLIAAIDVDGAVPLGDYTVIVAPPLSPPECQGIGEGVFSVT